MLVSSASQCSLRATAMYFLSSDSLDNPENSTRLKRWIVLELCISAIHVLGPSQHSNTDSLLDLKKNTRLKEPIFVEVCIFVVHDLEIVQDRGMGSLCYLKMDLKLDATICLQCAYDSFTFWRVASLTAVPRLGIKSILCLYLHNHKHTFALPMPSCTLSARVPAVNAPLHL